MFGSAARLPAPLHGRFAAVTCLALAGLVAGCGLKAHHSEGGDAGAVISAPEIERSGARTMWEAIRRNVRFTVFTESGFGEPERIRRRGASSLHLREDMRVFVDGLEIHDVRVLDEMPAHEIDNIRVLTGIHATTYYGTNSTDGVILIATRARRR